MSAVSNVKVGRVNIPVLAILMAIPAAIKAASDAAAADHAASSPGGEKVTPEEVLGIIGAFLHVLGDAVLPAVLKANGL